MSPDTSSAGRFQFSEEKAKTVSTATLRSRQARMQRRRLSIPWRWPARRGRKRLVAQRPLPSMTMAMCCGVASDWVMAAGGGQPVSDSHHFLFLARHQLVDGDDVLVGQLLDIGFRAF